VARSQNPVDHALDYLATLQVPHSWFASFYLTSVSCSLLCAVDYAFSGPIFTNIAAHITASRPSMTFHQVFITWIVVLAQGSRRLYECHAFSRPSKSTMWVGHWILGMGFYVGLNLAIWVEGIEEPQIHAHRLVNSSALRPHIYHPHHLHVRLGHPA
jgi:3-oxo-5-alpha-steroid 4-dehydrogenase 3